jgi:plasmid stabilization system protein ParE
MKIGYSTRALADLEDILTFIQSRNPRAAAAIMTAVEDRVSLLATFPLMAPETDEPGIREVSLVRYPYKIYSEIVGDDVWILHIRHTRRRPRRRQI